MRFPPSALARTSGREGSGEQSRSANLAPNPMKISIYPTRNPDTGATVFRWVITLAGQWAAGGYCATRADAINDASRWILANASRV